MICHHALAHVKLSGGAMEEFISFVDRCIVEKKKAYCVPLNVTKYVVAKKNAQLRDVIMSADVVIADGKPLCWFARKNGYKDVQHITGIDFAEQLLSYAEQQKRSVFLFGASTTNVGKTCNALRRMYPHLRIAGSLDGFSFNDDRAHVVKMINDARPDIILVALGMPQKELFVAENLHALHGHFILPVGGAFDVWSGEKKRAPQCISSFGLEWLYRAFYDISKLMNILVFGGIFLKDMLFCGKSHLDEGGR